MGEYLGSEHLVSLQKSLRKRRDEFAASPLLSNGGRIMNILDPVAYGWENVRRDAERDGFVGLTMVNQDRTLAQLVNLFGEEAEFPFWQVFTGAPERVLYKCAKLLAEIHLPSGWRLESFTHPSEEIIEMSQQLNLEAGVAPAPAYYLRGDEIPSMLTCLYDEAEQMIACASGSMRYHPKSKLSGWMFAGGVSVSPAHRRRQLGSYLNASLLCDSMEEFGWNGVLEQAAADNPASVGMIRRCGLDEIKGTVTVVVNLTGNHITR